MGLQRLFPFLDIIDGNPGKFHLTKHPEKGKKKYKEKGPKPEPEA
jgi:hypothetical protein